MASASRSQPQAQPSGRYFPAAAGPAPPPSSAGSRGGARGAPALPARRSSRLGRFWAAEGARFASTPRGARCRAARSLKGCPLLPPRGGSGSWFPADSPTLRRRRGPRLCASLCASAGSAHRLPAQLSAAGHTHCAYRLHPALPRHPQNRANTKRPAPPSPGPRPRPPRRDPSSRTLLPLPPWPV